MNVSPLPSLRRTCWSLLAAVSLLIGVSLTITSCDEDATTVTPPAETTFDSYLAQVWFSLTYNRVKAEGITPPPASRIYGYFGVTMYEAVVGGSSKHESVASQLNGSL